MTIPKPDLDPSRPRRLVLAASTGGHLAQLVRLAPGLGAREDSLWITHPGPQSESLLAGRNVMYVPYVGPRDASGVLRAFQAIRSRMRAERFYAAVSTGAALALAALPAARSQRVPTLYIESVSRVDGPSLSGRVLATTGLAEVRTQHPSWSGGRWGVHPPVLSTFRSVTRDVDDDRPLKVFVTLGTHERFRFDSLVDRLLSLGVVGPDSVWQLGCTPAQPGMPGRVHAQMKAAEFERAAREADVVVTHSGVGTIMGLLEMGIFPVAVVRRKARGEHVDDHQAQIARLITELEVGAGVEVDELDAAVLNDAASREVRPIEKQEVA